MAMPGPDTRVVEIRVAGLVGTSGETLLDAVSTVDVAGDADFHDAGVGAGHGHGKGLLT
ncbi:integral membrane protein, partial [Amycolatopsis vancoresmycina DSM 44592]